MEPNDFIFILGEINGKLGALQSDMAEVKELQKVANGKTSKNTNAITRLNLVVFGIGGPLSLAGIVAILRIFTG